MGHARRDFLTSLVSGLVATANSRIGSAQQAPAPAAPEAAAPEGAITATTVAEAEKLVALEFTPEQQQLLAKSLPGQVRSFEARRRYDLTNSAAPAYAFDPRVPGVAYRLQSNRVRSSRSRTPTLPDSDVDIAFASVIELSHWIRTRQLSSLRLTEIYLKRLKSIGPKLECVVHLTEDLALQQARKADQEITGGHYRGLLHGIPWGAKDLLATAGIPTTWGAEPYRDQVPAANAHCVDLLAKAGAVLVAKLSTGALARGDVWFGGKTRNPWNTDEGSSGSSAGPAAATAAGLVGFAIGTQTGGSIVGPSIRCGVTGLVTSFSRVSRSGAMVLAWSLDRLGPICRYVEDTGVVLAAINGLDASDPSSLGIPFEFDATAGIEGMKLGFVPELFETAEVNDVERASLQAARSLGIKMVELKLSISQPVDELARTIMYSEGAAAFDELLLTGRDREFVQQGHGSWPIALRTWRFIPAVEYIQAQRIRRDLLAPTHALFEPVDAIISPSRDPILRLSNMTGYPCLTLRTGFFESPSRENGPGAPSGPTHTVPNGITLWGKLFEEGRLLNLGLALERKVDVARRRPPTG
ncbi:MAG TPA: amidase [Steroidobacteraceae bacterium]|nr:amidase [Steroidobacteraceae bacterium]